MQRQPCEQNAVAAVAVAESPNQILSLIHKQFEVVQTEWTQGKPIEWTVAAAAVLGVVVAAAAALAAEQNGLEVKYVWMCAVLEAPQLDRVDLV